MNRQNHSGLVLSLLLLVALGALAVRMTDQPLEIPMEALEAGQGTPAATVEALLPTTPELGDYGISAASFADLARSERIATPVTEPGGPHVR